MRQLLNLIGMAGFGFILYYAFEYRTIEFKGFLNLPGILLVGVGHLFIVLYSYPFKNIKHAWEKFFRITFTKDKVSFSDTIETLVDASKQYRKRGRILNTSTNDPFLKESIEVFNNNYPKEELKRILKNKWHATRIKGFTHVGFFDFCAKIVPALGMMGTVLGLVALLQNMEDFSKIGSGMALALLTTLYGLIISYGFYHPLSRRVYNAVERESFCQAMVVEGLELIKSGIDGPILAEQLQSFKIGSDASNLSTTTKQNSAAAIQIEV